MKKLSKILHRPLTQRDNQESKQLVRSKYIKDLTNYIEENEEVYRLVEGVHNDLIGVLVATDQRLLFVAKGLMRKAEYELKYEDVIASVAVPKLFMSTVLIVHGKDRLVIERVARRHAKSFVKFVEARSSKARSKFVKKPPKKRK